MIRATKSYKHVWVSHVKDKSCDTFHLQTVGGANFGATKPPDEGELHFLELEYVFNMLEMVCAKWQ